MIWRRLRRNSGRTAALRTDRRRRCKYAGSPTLHVVSAALRSQFSRDFAAAHCRELLATAEGARTGGMGGTPSSRAPVSSLPADSTPRGTPTYASSMQAACFRVAAWLLRHSRRSKLHRKNRVEADPGHHGGRAQGGYIFYAGASLAGVSCRRRWPRLLLLS